MTQTPTDALRLVPARLTEEMINSYYDACRRYGFHAHINATAAWTAFLKAAPASPLPGGGERRIKSELDFIKDIAANVQRDLAELEDGFSKSQRTAKTDRAVAKMRERCAVLIQCADDALNALPDAPTGDSEKDLIDAARRRFDLPPGDTPADYLIQLERDLQSDDSEVALRAHRKADRMRKPRL